MNTLNTYFLQYFLNHKFHLFLIKVVFKGSVVNAFSALTHGKSKTTVIRGVQKTHRPVKHDPTRPDPTRPVGLGRFLRLGGLGWIIKKKFRVDRVGFGS